MELLNRYRNVTVLLLVIFAQLVLLGYQVKSNQDIRLVRVWAVTAVTPVAKVIESVRSTTVNSLGNYISLHNQADENKKIKIELGKLKLDNQYLRSELESADRAVALSAYQRRSPSKTVPARVIGTGTSSATSRVVFIDLGMPAGVLSGMAVITPDGIVGKIIATYPTASQVLLIDDPTFAAGVISQKHRIRGTVRGLGQSKCMVDYIQNEEQVDQGEWFYTSGDDGVFPKGLPVGQVAVVRNGNPNKQVFLTPSGLQGGLEEILVILEGTHQPLPDLPSASAEVHIQAPPPPDAPAASQEAGAKPPTDAAAQTEADRLRNRYRQIGEAQNHKFGVGQLGTKPPDFNMSPEETAARAKAAATAAAAKASEAAKSPAAPATGAPKPAASKPAAAGGAAAGGAPRPSVPATAAPKPAAPKPAGAGIGTAPSAPATAVKPRVQQAKPGTAAPANP